MDRQDAALRERLRGTGVSVTRTGPNGEHITLNMPGNVTFAVDSADISASFYPVLDSVGLVFKEYDKTMVEVAGHTDSDGSDAYNQQLSERRASSVVAYLVSRQIRGDRFLTVGAGEGRPIASNATPEGKQQNRRVEITIVPLTT
jgi:outer membrane protein OmpA-like peptidoglycan-associated protein